MGGVNAKRMAPARPVDSKSNASFDVSRHERAGGKTRRKCSGIRPIAWIIHFAGCVTRLRNLEFELHMLGKKACWLENERATRKTSDTETPSISGWPCRRSSDHNSGPETQPPRPKENRIALIHD